MGGSSTGRATVLGTAGSRFESWAPSSCLRSSSGQSAFLVRTRTRVRISAKAPCGRGVTVAHDVPVVGVAGSIPVVRSQ